MSGFTRTGSSYPRARTSLGRCQGAGVRASLVFFFYLLLLITTANDRDVRILFMFESEARYLDTAGIYCSLKRAVIICYL